MKFHVGQRVRVIAAAACFQHFIGVETTILSIDRGERDPFQYELDLLAGGQHLYTSGRGIVPIDDRPELATWEAVHASCGWMPGMGVAL
jgi:hypothetical protein